VAFSPLIGANRKAARLFPEGARRNEFGDEKFMNGQAVVRYFRREEPQRPPNGTQ